MNYEATQGCNIGAAECGKTSIVCALKGVEHISEYEPTIGVEVIPIRFDNIVLSFWDIAGRDEYGIGKNMYITQVDLIICTCSLEGNVQEQLARIKQSFESTKVQSPNVKFMIIGLKSDLSNVPIPTSLMTCSAFTKQGIPALREALLKTFNS